MAFEETDVFEHLPGVFDLAQTDPEHLGDPRRFAVALWSALPSAVVQTAHEMG